MVDAVSDHAVRVDGRRIGRVDLFAVHHEFRLAALHLNAQLVHRAAARVGLRDGVARGPFDHRRRARHVAAAPTDRVHAVDRPDEEVCVRLTGVCKVLAADENAERFGVSGVLHLRHLGDDMIVP